MTKQTLFLFTNSFPYFIGEEYIEDEIPVLSNHFDEIYLIPSEINGDKRALPDHCSVIQIQYPTNFKKIRILFANLPLLATILLSETFGFNSFKKAFFRIIPNFYLLTNQLFRLDCLSKILKENKHASYYSYWTNEWSILLAIARKKGLITKFVSRIHGYDLFEERYPGNYIPFRKLQFQESTNVVSISQKGLEYLKSRYKKYAYKFGFCYLGVNAINKLPPLSNNKFHILSCSRMDPNKRVELIAESINQLNFEVHWTHIGFGDSIEKVNEITSTFASNPTYHFTGEFKKRQVIEFYENNCIDLFINLSKSEGLPVTLMEAISFGIPIMATDVGGTSEIVNDITGVLLPSEPDSKFVSHSITTFYKSNQVDNSEKRQFIKKFWNEHFNAQINYENFYNSYLS